MRILVTEDNQDLAKITALNLKKEGFAVDLASTGAEAIQLLEDRGNYDLIILDLVLPDADGFKLLPKIKSLAPKVPVLALTTRDAKADRIKGIKIGFDDYLTKPFSLRELVARLRVLSRSRFEPEEEIEIGPLKIFPKSHRLVIKAKPIMLTLNEFRLLYYLAQNKGHFVSNEELLTNLWDRWTLLRYGKLVTTVSRLRKKLGKEGKKLIHSSRGGYLMGLANA